ncbi:hypothetical protein POV27_10100 [Aureisphaera galaxeae]|uniref:DUF6768 family protein n=1 Tax=Aureisphaera galaxeae TaxID=1538023 RepID=UPI0023507244|nr:DUF6768 family protein [Aureisphaera galaxeae]MDC8004404.1 hypothetical protein [Aureisphaera galaxeae]
MKNKMEEIDELIKDTLSKEEAQFYDQLDEQNVFEMMRGLFVTRNRWFIVLVNIVNLAGFALFIFCLVRFFQAETTKDIIMWTSGGFLGLMITGMLKLFMWLQMDKNAILRELKRLELQVSSLAGKMSQ